MSELQKEIADATRELEKLRNEIIDAEELNANIRHLETLRREIKHARGMLAKRRPG